MAEEQLPPDLPEEEELAAADDRVIGRALRRSLWVLAGLGAVALIAFIVSRRPEEVIPETVIETAPPEPVRQVAEAPAVAFTDITAAAALV